jgi:methionine sulfoxide reductase heme-binding subunit
MEKPLASWQLFGALAVTTSLAVSLGLPFTDFHSARGTEFIIVYSVRCALPWFLVAFTASSLATLWPCRTTRWLLSNRRYFGLAFAWGMAWHLAFVAYSIIAFGNPLNRTVLTLDLVGLSFLLALTVTSFRSTARRLGSLNWRRLHKAGIYAIWLLATYIYAENVRGGPDPLHSIALGLLLAAWLLRISAWVRRRLLRRAGAQPLRGPVY